jgi:hypothetical protein
MKFYSPVKLVFLPLFLLLLFLCDISLRDNSINNRISSTFHEVVLSVNDNSESNYAYFHTISILRHKSVSISNITKSELRCCSLAGLRGIQPFWSLLRADIYHLYIIKKNTNIKINKFPK